MFMDAPQEPLSTIQATVGAALAAELPAGCRRLVYLCDDGKDAAKQAYMAGLTHEGARCGNACPPRGVVPQAACSSGWH
jgi:hypothetical protein